MPFDLDSMFGGSVDDFAAQQDPSTDDLTNPRNIMLIDEWANASPEKRKSELVDVAFNAHLAALEADKTKKIEIEDEKGEKQQVSIFLPDGNVSNQGRDYLARTKSMFEAAAESPTGGVYEDEFDGTRRVEGWADELYKKRKQVDPLEDYDKLKQANDSYQEGEKSDWSFDKYIQLKNEELGLKEGDPARLSTDNKALKEQFDNRKELSEVTKESFGDNMIIKKGGVHVLNPDRIGEIEAMENSINSLDISSSDKKMMLLDYRNKFKEVGGKYVSEAAAAQASSVSILPQSMSGNPLAALSAGPAAPLVPILRDAGGRLKEAVGMDRQDLHSKFERFMSEGKGDVYDFAKENADVFNKDNYNWGDKLSNEFWSAGRATGAGLMVLGSKLSGNDDFKQFAADFASDSQSFTDMASKGLMNEEVVGPMGVTNKDLYNVGGQIANMMATFGAGSLVKAGVMGLGKVGMAKAIATAAAKSTGAVAGSMVGGYAGEAIGEAIGGETGGNIGGVAGSILGGFGGWEGAAKFAGSKAAVKAAGIVAASEKRILGAADELAKKSFVHRTALQMAKDPSAYVGAMQATGLTFGSEYNRLIQEGVPVDQAFDQASKEGLINGASAFIATSVFNRIAPGAERLMSGVEGSMSKSFIKNVASRLSGRAGMEATRKTIEGLAKDPKLASAIFKGVKATMNESAKKAGLRGFGMLGDVASEGLEEMTDELLSDAFSFMLDDSKSWEDGDVWGHISENFKDYLKVGLLGSLGGAMGGGLNSGSELGKLAFSPEARAKFKEETRTNIQTQWQMLKETSEKFTPEIRAALSVDPNNAKALNLAEYVASFEGPITPKLIAEKSKAFTSTALLGQKDFTSTVKSAEASPDTKKEPQIPLAEAMDKFSQKEPGQSNHVLQAVYGENDTYSPDLEVAPEKKGIKITGDPEFKGAMLHPVRIGKESSAVAMVVKKDGTVSYVSPTKAKELLASNGQAKLAPHIASFDETISRQQSNIDNEWTTKQTATSNGSNQQEPVTSQKDNGNSGTTKGDGDSTTTNSSPAEQAQRAKVALPSKGLAKVIKISNGHYKVSTPSGEAVVKMSDDAQASKLANEMAAKSNQSLSAEEIQPKPIITNESKTETENKQTSTETNVERQDEREVLDPPIKKASSLRDKLLEAKKKAEEVTEPKIDQAQKSEDPVSGNGIKLDALKADGGNVDTVKAIDSIIDLFDSLEGLKEKGVSKKEVVEIASKAFTESGLSDQEISEWSGEFENHIADLYPEDTSKTPKIAKKAPRPVFNESGVPLYVVNGKELENPDSNFVDSVGGRWEYSRKNGIDSYSYIPAEGKTMDISVGSVVSIGTENGVDTKRVLVLAGIVGRAYVFKQVNLEDTLSAAQGKGSITKLHQLGEQWNNNRLMKIADKLRGDLPKILLADGEVNEKEFKEILRSVFAVIAPNFDTNDIEFKSLKGDSFFTTEMNEAGEITIAVDRVKMLAELRQIFDGYKPNQDASYDMFVATDVARMFAKWADEESIHMALLTEFTQEGDRDKLIAAANEAAQASGRAESIRRIYEKTAAERFEGTAIDALTDDQKIVVFHEVMRKVSQLVTSGSFTEMQTDEVKMLISAMNEDATLAKAKTGVFKGLKTVMELLHRYMRKMSNMLFTRQLMGQLSPEMKQLFQRVESATSKAGLRGDVDMIADKVLQKEIFEYEQYKASASKDIAKAVLSSDSSDAINLLKSFVSGPKKIFPNTNIEDIVEVDYIAGTLKLNDTARAFIGEYRPDVDLDKIDAALSILNANPIGNKDTALSDRGESSVRLAQLQLVMANRALEAARYRVGNILDMFNITSASVESNLRQEDRQGAFSDDKRRNQILENTNNLRDFISRNGKFFADDTNYELMAGKLMTQKEEALDKYEKDLMSLDQMVISSIDKFINNPTLVVSQNEAFDIADKIGYKSINPSIETLEDWGNGLMYYAKTIAIKGFDGKVAYSDNMDAGTLASMVYGVSEQVKENTDTKEVQKFLKQNKDSLDNAAYQAQVKARIKSDLRGLKVTLTSKIAETGEEVSYIKSVPETLIEIKEEKAGYEALLDCIKG